MEHSNNPTIRASKPASLVYSSSAVSLSGSTMADKALETRRDTSATGPMASCLEDPKIAYTKIGVNPESAKDQKIVTKITDGRLTTNYSRAVN
jgi:hypothetical protein